MATLTLKTGDNIEWVCTMNESGIAADITTWTIGCEVDQSDGTLVLAMTVTKTDPTNGIFSLTATALQTASFPVGDLLVDVQILDDSSITVSSETFNLTMVQDITS